MNHNLILDNLRRIDLKNDNREQIKNLIHQLDSFGSMLYYLYPGTSIHRARPNFNNEIFRVPKDLSYKPQELNKKFQRASSPNRTAFYGCLSSTKSSHDQAFFARVTGSVESISWIRDPQTIGYQKVTFGQWIVKERIELMAILHSNFWGNSSAHFENMILDLERQLDLNSSIKSKTIDVLTFFANEFSKDKINSHEDYMLSAFFAEVIMDSGADGILYPSVRTLGEGLNVAIHPDVADTKLELQLIAECSIYKKKEKSIIGFDKLFTTDAKNNFETEIFLPNNPTPDDCIKKIGAINLDELISNATQ